MLYSQDVLLSFSSDVRSLSLRRDASAVTPRTSFRKVDNSCVCRDAILQGELCQLPWTEIDEGKVIAHPRQ